MATTDTGPARRCVISSLGFSRLVRHEFAADLRAERHLDDAVVHIALHARLGTEHDTFAAEDVTVDAAVERDARGLDRSIDDTELADGQRCRHTAGRAHAPGDTAIDMEPPGELDITLDTDAPADQRLDLSIADFLAFEHRSARIHAPDEGLAVGCHAFASRSNFYRDMIGPEVPGKRHRLLDGREVAKIERQLILSARQCSQIDAGGRSLARAIDGDCKRAVDRLFRALRAAQREAQREALLSRQGRDAKLLYLYRIGRLLPGLCHQALVESHFLLISSHLRLQLTDGARHLGSLAALAEPRLFGRGK